MRPRQLTPIVAWEWCDRRRYLIGNNRASEPSLRLQMSSSGREPTLPTGAPVAAPAGAVQATFGQGR
jgi:hypothetical protein